MQNFYSKSKYVPPHYTDPTRKSLVFHLPFFSFLNSRAVIWQKVSLIQKFSC